MKQMRRHHRRRRHGGPDASPSRWPRAASTSSSPIPVPQAAALDAKFDGRVSALAYAIGAHVRGARRLAASRQRRAADQRHPGHRRASSSGEPSPFSLHFDAAEVGCRMRSATSSRTATSAPACSRWRATLAESALRRARRADRSRERWPRGIAATLANGETITATLAVAADGRDSPMRELMGLQVISWSYPQWGIVATVAHEKPHNGVAYEHFLPSGPFAILPMTGNRSSLVWTETETLAPAMMKLAARRFRRGDRAPLRQRIWARPRRPARAGPIR